MTPADRKRVVILLKTLADAPGRRLDAQRQRVVAALKHGPLTATEAQAHLGVLDPSARVAELNRAGFRIAAELVDEARDGAPAVRTARYRLVREAP